MGKARFYLNNAKAPKPNKPNHIGAIAIIEVDGKVLLEQRSDSGKWAFIGGGLKIDESLEMCIKREVLEESGLIVVDMNLFNIFSNPTRIAEYPDGNVLRIITIAFIVEVEQEFNLVCSNESIQLKFFTIDELKTVDIAETHIDIRDTYINYKNTIMR